MAVAVVAFSSVGLLPASVAQADSGTPLPIAGFDRIVADSAHGHLFISQGDYSGSSQILVTDMLGDKVAAISGQDGAMGMVLSPDGTTLYVALASDDAVSAISTTTLRQTASYPLGAGNSPVDVAVQSGKIWVSYNTATAGSAAIGDINLAASAPAFQSQAAMGGWATAPNLSADPSDTGILVALVAPTNQPTLAASYNVAADPPAALARADLGPDCGDSGDLAVLPGGAQVIVSCGDSAPVDSTADLSQVSSDATGGNPADAVAADARGDVASGGQSSGDGVPNLDIYPPGAATPVNTYDTGVASYIALRGMAWSADGSQLSVVMDDDPFSPSIFTLQTFSYPALTGSALAMSGPQDSAYRQPLTLTGQLTVSSGPLPPAATLITITRSAAGTTATATFAVPMAADGSFTLTDTPSVPGSYTYTASYGGSTTLAPATATYSVVVNPLPTTLTLTAGAATVTYPSASHLTAHLGTTYRNRTISIYAQAYGSKTRTLIKTAKVNSHGNLTISYTAAHNTVFSADFTGDTLYAPATATATVSVRVGVSETLSGYYSSERIGRTTYRRYHRGNPIRAQATISPDKHGHCTGFVIQKYSPDGWQQQSQVCVNLAKSSKATATLHLTHARAGARYRIRAQWPAAADLSNLPNNSSWQYLIIEK
jgi:YVTN family beta-propeller protein